MNPAIRAALAILALAWFSVTAAVSPLTEAREAALRWLAVMDEGAYGDSWEQAATLFRIAIAKENWQRAAKSARREVGKPLSREFKSATFTRALPGAPAGEYVIVQFIAKFENRASAAETVSMTREPDGVWRVAVYNIG
jgi:Protein of unknown function (DUF4019)